MKKIILFILLNFIGFTSIYAALNNLSTSCDKYPAPKVIKPMANWEIIAGNTAAIPMKEVFNGEKLNYFISSSAQTKNKSLIDKKSGLIHIKAAKKDNFYITVKAKNPCGIATNTFNVIIDEEE